MLRRNEGRIDRNAAACGVFYARLWFAMLCTVLVAACGTPDESGPAAPPLRQLSALFCTAEPTPIAGIQGSGAQSPRPGTSVFIRGIVTWAVPGTGFYLEEILSDSDPQTSDALYVDSAPLSERFRAGDEVALAGNVAELGQQPHSLTALTQIEGYRRCAQDQPLPLHDVGLPLNTEQREALEGMRIQVRQDLAVTDVYSLVSNGRFGVSLEHPLRAPTEYRLPGPAAVAAAKRNRERRLNLVFPGSGGPQDIDAVGDRVFDLSGVLTQASGRYEVILESIAASDNPGGVPKLPQKAALRVVGFNLENYFNGDGAGGGFPGLRGARSLEAFQEQRRRLLAAVQQSAADVLALTELENDGFGPASAIQDLAAGLNSAGASNAWQAVVVEGYAASGPIRVGILYRADVVAPAAPAEVLTGPLFTELSRPPVAQLFTHRQSGEKLLIAVNHLKSKGRCPAGGPDADQSDGQGCWNQSRLDAAVRVHEWMSQLAQQYDVNKQLMLGDFNAYRLEDPITRLKALGWQDAVEVFSSSPYYSYNYRGELGSLDYAFFSPALTDRLAWAGVWHINSGYPEYPPGYPAGVFRSSDHDPVVVDIAFSDSQPNANP